MPVKVFNFLPTPLNTANDDSPSGFANIRTLQQTNAGGLVLGDAIDLTDFEAAGLSSPNLGVLFEGRYRRVQVAATATAANVGVGKAAFVNPGTAVLAVLIATPGSGQTPGVYQVFATPAAPAAAAAGNGQGDHPKDNAAAKASSSMDTHHNGAEDEEKEDRKPPQSAGTRYDAKAAKKLNHAGPEHEKVEGVSQVPGPPATEKAKPGPAAAPGARAASGVGSGAIIQVVVGTDGTVTAQPKVVAAGSGYTSAPTFTLSAGGTAATFQAQMVVDSYIVTDAATPGINLSQGRGVFLNSITPGNYGWIQENGIASFLSAGAGAAGSLLTPNATGLFAASAVGPASPAAFGTSIDVAIANVLIRGLMTLPVWNG